MNSYKLNNLSVDELKLLPVKSIEFIKSNL